MAMMTEPVQTQSRRPVHCGSGVTIAVRHDRHSTPSRVVQVALWRPYWRADLPYGKRLDCEVKQYVARQCYCPLYAQRCERMPWSSTVAMQGDPEKQDIGRQINKRLGNEVRDEAGLFVYRR